MRSGYTFDSEKFVETEKDQQSGAVSHQVSNRSCLKKPIGRSLSSLNNSTCLYESLPQTQVKKKTLSALQLPQLKLKTPPASKSELETTKIID